MIIYLITNLINGKKYVGETVSPEGHRWSKHCYEAKTNPLTVLHKAIAKYGPDGFKREILGTTNDFTFLNIMEQVFIKHLKTKIPNGYNLTDGGEGAINPPEEIRQKLKTSKLGDKNPMFGKHHTNEAKQKLSAALTGKHKAIKPTPPDRTGTTLSEEHKRKISMSGTGRKHSDETRLKMSISRRQTVQRKRDERNSNVKQSS